MSKFSRQHYTAIAAVLKEAQEVAELDVDGHDAVGVQLVREGLVDLFAQDNPSFDKDAFIAASVSDRLLFFVEELTRNRANRPGHVPAVPT